MLREFFPMEVINFLFYLTCCYLNWNSIQQTFIFLHNPVTGSWLIRSTRDRFSQKPYWSRAQSVLQGLWVSLCSEGWGEQDGYLGHHFGPLEQLPAQRSALYYWFSMRSISEAIFSFPDNLSWNIKDSLTTVNLQLILEWHSDVSQYSLILKWIHPLLCSAVSWIEVYTAQYQTVNLILSAMG